MTDAIGAADVLERLAAHLEAKSDADIARKLNVSRTAVSSWRQRGSIPYAECVTVAKRDGISLDWLLLGIGPECANNKTSGGTKGRVDWDTLALCLQTLEGVEANMPKLPFAQRVGVLREVYNNLIQKKNGGEDASEQHTFTVGMLLSKVVIAGEPGLAPPEPDKVTVAPDLAEALLRVAIDVVDIEHDCHKGKYDFGYACRRVAHVYEEFENTFNEFFSGLTRRPDVTVDEIARRVATMYLGVYPDEDAKKAALMARIRDREQRAAEAAERSKE